MIFLCEIPFLKSCFDENFLVKLGQGRVSPGGLHPQNIRDDSINLLQIRVWLDFPAC